LDRSVHREAHSYYFGFEIPLVTATEAMEAPISRIGEAPLRRKQIPRVERVTAREGPFSPRNRHHSVDIRTSSRRFDHGVALVLITLPKLPTRRLFGVGNGHDRIKTGH
jgi:hypothetical protein